MSVQSCAVCGCTNDAACTWFEVMGDGRTERFACYWVKPDLCSECAPATRQAPAEPQPLLYDAAGAPLVFK